MSDDFKIDQTASSADREHCIKLIRLLDGFSTAMLDKELGNGQTFQEISVIKDRFSELLEQQTRAPEMNILEHSNIHLGLLQYLSVLKAQLFKETLSAEFLPALEGKEELFDNKDPAGTDFDQRYDDIKRLSDSFKSLRNKPLDIKVFDDVFEKLDNLLAIQYDYTLAVVGENGSRVYSAVGDTYGAFISTFADQVNNIGKVHSASVDYLTAQIDVYVEQVQPELQKAQELAQETSRQLAENAHSLEEMQKSLEAAEQNGTQTRRILLRTQTGIDATRKQMGLAPEFGDRMQVVPGAQNRKDDKGVVSIQGKEPPAPSEPS